MSRLDFTRFVCLVGIAGFWFIAVPPVYRAGGYGIAFGTRP